MGRHYAIEQLQEKWARYYRELDAILGPTYTQVPLGDPTYGLASAATFLGRRRESVGLAPIWTPSEAFSAFDNPLVPTLEKSYQGNIPILDFNGTDEEADTPDAAGWTPTVGLSVALWVFLDDITSVDFIGRWDLTTVVELREWRLFMDATGQFNGVVYDETANAQLGRLSARALQPGRWYHLVMTYSGGTTAAAVILYVNGMRDDTADSIAGTTFATIKDTATLTRLGFNITTGGASGSFFNGKMAGGPGGPIVEMAEWTPQVVKALYARQKGWML